jgi:hypothetical protein
LNYKGFGPGDDYIGMCRVVNRYRYRLNILDQEMRADTTTCKWRGPENRQPHIGQHEGPK